MTLADYAECTVVAPIRDMSGASSDHWTARFTP